MVAGVGKGKKNAFVALLGRAVRAEDDFARALVESSRDYASWAKLARARGRREGDAHADALRLLDSKGHLLNVLDRACEVEDGDDGAKDEVERARRVREAWTKTKATQRAKFEKSGGAEGVAEARLRKREAKERINASRKEREAREARDKERKEARLEYATKVHEARSAGACLDWLNMGRCRFGEECQFEHDAMSRGNLKDLAVKVGAETGDVKRERNQTEKAERKARAKAMREAGGGDDEDTLGGRFSSSEDESDDDEGDVPGFLKIERARRAAEALLATNKTSSSKTNKDAGKSATKKAKHFNEKQLEKKQKFLKEGKNQPFVKKGMKKRPQPTESAQKNKKKKPRRADSERKQKRKGMARTFFGGDD